MGEVGDDGVEFDAQDKCIILKEYPGWMHACMKLQPIRSADFLWI